MTAPQSTDRSEQNDDPSPKPQTCFVVMPFGTKPRGPQQTPHDFDKVYRVVIKRAVQLAGMRCIRADEESGSRLIHTDMFRDLRDQPLVIADLSLQNPNVFYELGVRHVMSSTGTVLMCETGSMPLPFDIGLSRVVPYEYDGANLDWEEAERLVELLRVALLESATGAPDSPVHALLERVLSDDGGGSAADLWSTSGELSAHQNQLERYERLVASTWRKEDVDLSDLIQGNSDNVFGSRTLGHYVLDHDELPEDEARQIASQLSDFAEFSLASEIYQRLDDEGKAGYFDLLRYAYTYSEGHSNLAGADRALELVATAVAYVDKHFENPESAGAVTALAQCQRREAGLPQWRWQLSQASHDLQVAIEAHGQAIDLMTKARKLGPGAGPHGKASGLKTPGMSSLLAQSHLKRMLLLRRQASQDQLIDRMGDLQAILDIKPAVDDDPKNLSYLRWYRAIALADSGAQDRARQCALEALAKDAELMNDASKAEIGRRQYVGLRRFLEEYSKWLRHPEAIGFIGQTLQVRR